MNRTLATVALLVVQVALVLSVAGKYLYERRTRPRVWARTSQVDPSLPFRGRYLALQLAIDACNLPHDAAHFAPGYKDFVTGKIGPGIYRWSVSLDAQGGQLIAKSEDHARSPRQTQYVAQTENQICERALLSEPAEFFLPDKAKTPFPLKSGEELWVEVTAPVTGPPRPIQLALSTSSGFHPMQLE